MTLCSQTKNFLDVPYLETSARVDTLVTPDKIYLSITIKEKDSKGKKSVEEQENKMAQRLKDLGIDVDQQLTIKNLASDFKKYFLRSKDVLKSKQYSLLVYDGLSAGKVMAALEDLGIANTYLEKTEYSKMDELELIEEVFSNASLPADWTRIMLEQGKETFEMTSVKEVEEKWIRLWESDQATLAERKEVEQPIPRKEKRKRPFFRCISFH